MIFIIDKETIREARQADLATYLTSIGVSLVREGNRYRLKEDKHLVIKKNAYYWNTKHEHGNSVDYLQRHMNMSFLDAVEALIGFVPEDSNELMNEQLMDIEKADNYKRVIAYLSKNRNIDYRIIKKLIDINHLYQENKTNNAIFPIYDEFGQYVGAEVIGTLSDIRFKGIKTGSKYGYGFNIRYSDTEAFDFALFFESAIDLISFIQLKQKDEKKSLKNCILVSMGGLKTNILQHTLDVFGNDLKVVLCVDNDEAGQAFVNSAKKLEIDFIIRFPDQKYKDWNEQLRAKRQE